MSFIRLIVVLLLTLCGAVLAQSNAEWQQRFAAALSAKVEAPEKNAAAAIVGAEGWLFLRAELKFLLTGQFWGADAARFSKSPKPENADPIPAIIDFRDQLKQRGIDLVLVPVPAKAAIYPEKIAADVGSPSAGAAPLLHQFYGELQRAGVDVLDLSPLFEQNRSNERGAVYCRTDTHWSVVGTVVAAHAIAEHIRAKVGNHSSGKAYVGDWQKIAINGDLPPLLGPGTAKPPMEEISARVVHEKGGNAGVQPDLNSPVLLLGDSHTLVFHDFLAEKAGLVDQLALELGFAPDLTGTRGSGASAVRVNLYRDSSRNPEYLAKKKVIVWCFTCREFTDADQGWRKLPIAK